MSVHTVDGRHSPQSGEWGIEAQIAGSVLKVRAERRLGELLAETVKHTGGGDRKSSRFHDETVIHGDLPDGIDKNQSHRWQRVASIPDGMFEDEIRKTVEASAG